jgi:MFS transporter, DHA1 family, tetracycline resistance protein
VALFCVGVASVLVQAWLLGILMKRLGEVRLSLLGLGSGAITYLLYGLATQGWMMYVLILCNLLAFAAGPALQAIISKATPATEQGELMGSLHAINSVGVVVMPLIGGFLLAKVSHLPSSDPRIGITFFVSAAMQAAAILFARRWFRDHHRAL